MLRCGDCSEVLEREEGRRDIGIGCRGDSCDDRPGAWRKLMVGEAWAEGERIGDGFSMI